MSDTASNEEPVAKAADSITDKLTFKSRFVLVFGEINDKMARATCERLIALAQESDAPIHALISSPGGHVESGDAIHDMIRFVQPVIRMVGTGWVASIAALIYVSVPREHRYCLPNTRFLLHQPAGGMGGSASDIDIEAKEILKMRERLNRMFSVATGQPVERIEQDTHRNFWLDAEAAVKYGLVGNIITTAAEIGGRPA